MLNRLAWYLTPRLPQGTQVLVPAEAELSQPITWSHLSVPDYEFNALRESPLAEFCRVLEPNLLQEAFETTDGVLVWNASCLQHEEIQAHLDRVLIVDPHFYLDVEATHNAGLRYLISHQAERDAQRENARRSYAEWFRQYTGIETACLFLTGPSLEAGLSRPLPANSLRIICNSLVKNDAFLEKIQPNLLVFADPAFHFGISRYAAVFRDQALKALARYPGCMCIVPERYIPLLLGHFSQELSGRLIGMPEEMEGDFNFPDPGQFWVRNTANILTHLMLPIASSLAPEIRIFGADGRQPRDAGFWQHNPAAQFGGLIETIYQAHPSLERDQDIEEYYAVHCAVVERMIQKGEQEAGRRYFSETPSFIPALSSRYGRSL